jgi:hypothetical protein
MTKCLSGLTGRLEAQLHRCLPTLEYLDPESPDSDPRKVQEEQVRVVGARLWLAVSTCLHRGYCSESDTGQRFVNRNTSESTAFV